MKRIAFVLFMLVAPLIIVGCIPDEYAIEIETTSELGPQTLSRIDDINDVLDRGIELGPDTLAAVEMLNETIQEGINFGFTDPTLERVDALLQIIEQGLGFEVGLDAETNATVNRLIDTINDAPGQWENTVTEIIQVLEGSTSNVAADMADEISALMAEARINTQFVTATVGTEFRCNVDFLSTRAGETVDQFIGRSIVGRLRDIITGRAEEITIPAPWVCQIIPDQINLIQVGEAYQFDMAVIKVSGYNYVEANLPTARIVDEAGQPVSSAPLYPFLSSPYQIQLNLQGIDFSTIPERSRVVFEWPTTGVSNALSMVFPEEEILPTEVPQAKLTVSAASVDVLKGPGANYHIIGRAEAGAEYAVTGQNGAGDWWQIDYDGVEAWVPNSAVTRNEVPTTVVSIPLPPPTANFQIDPPTGNAPLNVNFMDSSSEGPFRWEWDFGDGSLPSFEQHPSHTFTNPGTYMVTLRVENDLGFGSASQSIQVDAAAVVELAPLILEAEIFIAPTPTPAFPGGSIIFKNFAGLGSNVHQNTLIQSSMYDCGIISMAATHGDIQENGRGNILYANLSEEGGSWWIHADFRTHHDHENWSIGVICFDKNYPDAYRFYRRVHVDPAVRETIDLEYLNIPEGYYCGVVGMGAWNGDIYEDGTGPYILKAYVQKNAGTGIWELTANFRTHGDVEETWDVDLLCVYDNPNVIRHEHIYQIFGKDDYLTGLHSSEYACGIVGMAALNGDIQENDAGNIFLAYTYIGADGYWYIQPDFRSHNTNEFWDIDMLCARSSSVNLVGDWSHGWVP
jgi:PKD repeat protein